MTRLLRVGLLAGLAVLLVSAVALAASPVDAGRASREAFRAQMRGLWNDHVVWTRMYIISAATLASDLPDISATANRLFANQADIGDAVGAFYGEEAGQALNDLLDEHIAIAAEAIAAAKAGDQPALQDALARWYVNADEIAAFLAAANPQNWQFDHMSAHMRHHLDLTLEEAVARLNGDYAADIAAYDEVRTQILDLADTLANGIIDQFPSRFGR
jgi:prophage DNA circulation protein